MNRTQIKETIEQTLAELVLESQGLNRLQAQWRRDVFQVVMKVATADDIAGAMSGLSFAAATLLVLYCKPEGIEKVTRMFDWSVRDQMKHLIERRAEEEGEQG